MHLERANLTICDFFLTKAVIIWENIGIVDVDFLQPFRRALSQQILKGSQRFR